MQRERRTPGEVLDALRRSLQGKTTRSGLLSARRVKRIATAHIEVLLLAEQEQYCSRPVRNTQASNQWLHSRLQKDSILCIRVESRFGGAFRCSADDNTIVHSGDWL
jgi:hypothetical protein